ncbi:MAG: hypothetical protein QOH25_1869 [Acidobacteriota bacterium]|jgi:dihydrofolate reductase|nr:hypothetical protein [Acidobacteriota bacterium]
MRKVTFGVANSLDNYIARSDGAVDWLLWSKDVSEIMRDFWKTIDTVLVGRKTYEAGLELSKGQKNPYPGVKTYVFSHTLKASKDEAVEIVRGDAVRFVRKLKSEKGKDICVMGGGEFAKSLFEAKLIDEIGFNIHPVLLGQGIPLFHEMKHQLDLELLECKTLKKGCVYVSYRVKH